MLHTAGLGKPKQSCLCLTGFAAGSRAAWQLRQSPFQWLCAACRETSSFWPTSMCLLDGGVSLGLWWTLAAAVFGAGQGLRQLEVQQLQPGDGSDSASVIIQQAFQGHEAWKRIVFFSPLLANFLNVLVCTLCSFRYFFSISRPQNTFFSLYGQGNALVLHPCSSLWRAEKYTVQTVQQDL